MKTIIAVLGFALLVMPALAATEQQEKRAKACNAAADKKALKGDKRKAYLKSCLAAKPRTKPDAAATPKTKPPRPATSAVPAPASPKPSAASPAANPPAPNSATDQKRLKCEDLARQSNVSPTTKKAFMDKCMGG
jgi:hypothetical protein